MRSGASQLGALTRPFVVGRMRLSPIRLPNSTRALKRAAVERAFITSIAKLCRMGALGFFLADNTRLGTRLVGLWLLTACSPESVQPGGVNDAAADTTSDN